MNEIIPLVSFPKSGNTWIRFILANLFMRPTEGELDFATINRFSPTTYEFEADSHSARLAEKAPIFVKDHRMYSNFHKGRFSRVIYIYRNGFDALNSYWHFTQAESPGLYRGIVDFSQNYQSYCGHWGEHIHSWIEIATREAGLEVHCVSYESLLIEPVQTIESCLRFLGKQFSDEEIQNAISKSDKKNMRKMSWNGNSDSAMDPNYHFVRSGASGEGKIELPENCLHRFMSIAKNYEYMTALGYVNEQNEWVSIPKINADSRKLKASMYLRKKAYSLRSRLNSLGWR